MHANATNVHQHHYHLSLLPRLSLQPRVRGPSNPAATVTAEPSDKSPRTSKADKQSMLLKQACNANDLSKVKVCGVRDGSADVRVGDVGVSWCHGKDYQCNYYQCNHHITLGYTGFDWLVSALAQRRHRPRGKRETPPAPFAYPISRHPGPRQCFRDPFCIRLSLATRT